MDRNVEVLLACSIFFSCYSYSLWDDFLFMLNFSLCRIFSEVLVAHGIFHCDLSFILVSLGWYQKPHQHGMGLDVMPMCVFSSVKYCSLRNWALLSAAELCWEASLLQVIPFNVLGIHWHRAHLLEWRWEWMWWGRKHKGTQALPKFLNNGNDKDNNDHSHHNSCCLLSPSLCLALLSHFLYTLSLT